MPTKTDEYPMTKLLTSFTNINGSPNTTPNGCTRYIKLPQGSHSAPMSKISDTPPPPGGNKSGSQITPPNTGGRRRKPSFSNSTPPSIADPLHNVLRCTRDGETVEREHGVENPTQARTGRTKIATRTFVRVSVAT